IMEVMGITTGTISVLVQDERNLPIHKAIVNIYKASDENPCLISTHTTNLFGLCERIVLEAPSENLSLDKNETTKPYETYTLEIIKNGYDIELRVGVQIFSNIHSTIDIILYPYIYQPNKNILVIEPHKLFNREGVVDA
ncbi:MAG: hypothetical protein RR890_08005, partial [Longicatena sp.]